MPIPNRRKGQPKHEFLSKCIADLRSEYPLKQATAICYMQMAKEEDNSQYVSTKQFFNKSNMNKEQLKELVKAHFNLVDPTPVKETFGEVYDENKAFKIVFPGDTLKVGDEVKVITAEGQETLAPDGYHKLEDGTMIKTEGSTVTEIETASGEKEEEMAEEGVGAVEKKADEEVAANFGADPAISQVEGTSPQNATTETDPNPEATVKTVAEMEAELMKKVKMAIDEAIASEITGIKEEMGKMKAKFDEFSASPATEKTTVNSKVKTEKFSAESLQDKQMKVMAELMKNKNK